MSIRRLVVFGTLLAIAAGIIIRGFVLETFRVATPLMDPDLKVGDVVVASKLSYPFGLPDGIRTLFEPEPPKVGEILLHGNSQHVSVGRVVATPGAKVFLDGNKIVEIESETAARGQEVAPLLVPIGQYLVLPEHTWTVGSLESHLVVERDIIGKVIGVWFSLDWESEEGRPKVRWDRLFQGIH